MALLGAWVGFPVALVAVCLGLGLLVSRGIGWRLSGELVGPVGFAVLVVVTQFLTSIPVLSRTALPVVLALSVIGSVGGWRGRTRYQKPDWMLVAVAVAVFGAFALPLVASGGAPFAGWMKLDDGATWLAFADRLADSGRTVSGLAPSSYERVLAANWPWYPIGAFAPLGVLAQIIPIDTAALLPSFMAVVAGLTSLVVAHVIASSSYPRWVSMTGALVAPQTALLYGFAMWGGIKELVVVLLLFCLVAIAMLDTSHTSDRSLAPALGLVVAALIAVAGPAGVLIAGPVLVWWFFLLAGGQPRRLGRPAAWLVGVSVALAAPTLVLFPSGAVGELWGFAGTDDDIGPLAGPLSPWAVMGVWPTGDFRTNPDLMGVAIAGGLMAGTLAVVGFYAGVTRRRWAVPALLTAVSVMMILGWLGNSWLGAKAMAVASPVVVTSAFAGIGYLAARTRFAAVTTAALLVTGVLWSNVLTYGSVWLAPGDQLAELKSIGSRFAGQGPALMLEYNPYAVRHYLRQVDAEGANELRSRPVALATGRMLNKAEPADIDDLDINGIADYQLLVLRRSGLASRPSGEFDLVWAGDYYEVWQRRASPLGVIAHLPLGSDNNPGGIPDCDRVAELAALTPPGGHLLAATRPATVRVDLDHADLPANWAVDQSRPGAVVPSGAGQIDVTFELPVAGEYTFWLEGSFRRTLKLSIDGRPLATKAHRLSWPGNPTELGIAHLTNGPHTARLNYGGSPFAPGANGTDFSIGPLLLATQTAADTVPQAIPADGYRQLCGISLDWVESVDGH